MTKKTWTWKVPPKSRSRYSIFGRHFSLVACTRLYNLLCRSIRLSNKKFDVWRFWLFHSCSNYSGDFIHCPCPNAGYPALFSFFASLVCPPGRKTRVKDQLEEILWAINLQANLFLDANYIFHQEFSLLFWSQSGIFLTLFVWLFVRWTSCLFVSWFVCVLLWN